MHINKYNLKVNTFLGEYFINGCNAKLAGEKAGYSPQAVAALMRHDYVQKQIELRGKLIQERNNINIDRIISEIARIAFFDIKDLYGEDNVMLPVHQMPEAARAAIAGIETEDIFVTMGPYKEAIGQTKKVKTNDKMQALVTLAKMCGFRDKVDVTINDNRQPNTVASRHVVCFEDLSITPHEEIKMIDNDNGST